MFPGLGLGVITAASHVLSIYLTNIYVRSYAVSRLMPGALVGTSKQKAWFLFSRGFSNQTAQELHSSGSRIEL